MPIVWSAVITAEYRKGRRKPPYPSLVYHRSGRDSFMEVLRLGVCGARCCEAHVREDPNAFFFVDPPYTAGGKNAGKRLYTHNDIDHEGLFSLMASVRGSVMMTYDDAEEVRQLAGRHGFRSIATPISPAPSMA